MSEDTANGPKAVTKKHRGAARLLRLVLLAAVLFVALALGEDQVEKYLSARAKRLETLATKATVERVVEQYNASLEKANNSNDPRGMAKLVTPEELRRIDTYITYNNYERLQRLENELLSLALSSVVLGKNGKSAIVKTREKWRYAYFNKETGKVAEAPKTTEYKATYEVKKTKGDWVVDRVTIDSQTPAKH